MSPLPRRPSGRRSRHRSAEPRAALDRRLNDLIDAHSDAVFHVAFGILHDRQHAEDVVQETMLRSWRSLGGFRGDSSERTWVLRIAHNTAIDALRRRRDLATDPVDIPEIEDRSDPADRAAGMDSIAAVGRALAELDALSRSIIVLREVEGMSYQEIADALDVPVATVKTRLLRARRTLQAAARDEEER